MSDDRRDRKGRNGGYRAPETEDAISRSLKRVYDEIADEPIPDALQSLLDRLKQQEGRRG